MLKTDVETWVVTLVDLSGFPSVVLAQSRNDAVSHFIQCAYLLIHALPEERLSVCFDDDDAFFTGLHLVYGTGNESLCLLSLTQAGRLKVESVPKEDIDKGQSFQNIASDLQGAINLMAGKLDIAQIQKYERSHAAFSVNFPAAPHLKERFDKARIGRRASSPRDVKTWAAMGLQKVSTSYLAKVQG